MLLRRITKHVTDQNWFAVFVDFLIVVVGVFIGIQVANWNDANSDREEQYLTLELLEKDIQNDIVNIEILTESLTIIVENYIFCLDVLARKNNASKSDFDKRFATILGVVTFTQNRTSFENLVSSGKLELIENSGLLNEIIAYYNTEYQQWDTAMRHYTRNIYAPYIMNFDHIPLTTTPTDSLLNLFKESYGVNFENYASFDITQFDVKPKTLDDYRNSVFIINMLIQKVFAHKGQIDGYKDLLVKMQALGENIGKEKEKLR